MVQLNEICFQKPWRLFDFKGKPNYIVPFDGQYVFKCKYPNMYFMNTNQKSELKLKCNGATSSYMNVETGETNVKLMNCIKGGSTTDPFFPNPNVRNVFIAPLAKFDLVSLLSPKSVSVLFTVLLEYALQMNMPFDRWEWHSDSTASCGLPKLSDDDTKTVFRNELCNNSMNEAAGCSIRVDCETGR
ncbi:unnamed protein product [Anisakis simplex]|uniref:Ricin B-type lectin domain-containing protein n=1 Tax=Anisakis simplex TaxID=6269 RepID=A0A0M3J8M9_ANISI|nr:unnamed protein product [Anisakis simplex]